jgi:hypothetical protein
VLAQRSVAIIDSWGWCSAGVLALEAGLSNEASMQLIEFLHRDGYLDEPHLGPLERVDHGKWLPSEELKELLLWHITTRGKALVKAQIGPPLTREAAEEILEAFLQRCEEINRDSRSSHWVDSVILYGSLCDSSASEIGDVDVAVAARIRNGDRDSGRRMSLENALRSVNTRMDVIVIDETWADGPVIPCGVRTRQVFPRTSSASSLRR